METEMQEPKLFDTKKYVIHDRINFTNDFSDIYIILDWFNYIQIGIADDKVKSMMNLIILFTQPKVNFQKMIFKVLFFFIETQN